MATSGSSGRSVVVSSTGMLRIQSRADSVGCSTISPSSSCSSVSNPNAHFKTGSEYLSGVNEGHSASSNMVVALGLGELTLVDLLENEYSVNRDHIVDENLAIRTPLKVVKDQAYYYGVPVELRTYEIHKPSVHLGPERCVHRVRISVGMFTGDGEAPRYRLAVQLAAADVLENMKKGKRGFIFPPYGLLPGCRTNPWVYKDLRAVCEMKNFGALPQFRRVSSDEIHLFAYKCIVNGIETIGRSDSIFLAKRLSARLMYEELVREPYPNDAIAVGAGCLNYNDLLAMGIRPVKWSDNAGQPTASNLEHGPHHEPNDEDELFEDDFAEDEDLIAETRSSLMKCNLTEY